MWPWRVAQRRRANDLVRLGLKDRPREDVPIVRSHVRGLDEEFVSIVGRPAGAVYRELLSVVPWVPLVLLVLGMWLPFAFSSGLGLLLARHATYGAALASNHFRLAYILYYIPAVVLYAAVLWASYRAHAEAKWRGKGARFRSARRKGFVRTSHGSAHTQNRVFCSHRYDNPALSPEENRRVFGKCNNPHGHGHNYTLEVTVAGEPDPVTGMVVDLSELKKILEREVMQRMDHRHLNVEVPELAGQIPTAKTWRA